MKEVILTREGYEKLRSEIEYLQTEKRREIAERIRIAREFGDISENAEYDDAKNEQAMLEHRIATLEERLLEARVVEDREITTDVVSIGPYVLSGGELPAMVVVDAIARLLPGALAEGSSEHESFSLDLDGGVEYPHYTRPAEFRGWAVPAVLLSGDHARIDAWRREQSRLRTVEVSL